MSAAPVPSPATVVVTGAAGNLGRAVARAFAERGAKLVLLGRSREALDALHGAPDDARLHIAVDLLDAAQVDTAAQAAIDRFGRIDVLCNIAGGFRMGPAVHQTSDTDFAFLIDINASTLLHAARAFVPRMLAGGGGKIVNVGAFAAQKGAANMGAYTAAKSTVIRLTEAMAAELRERNINVNCVLPTVIDTPENRKAMPKADPGRWVAPDDLARVIVFLASPEAVAIHGAALPVTGLS
ncbi:MAG: SDR family oxidoreductase [Burkholderiales bacterium]|nr:SDR family oxidoreductase [Burkholderiales bacterium]